MRHLLAIFFMAAILASTVAAKEGNVPYSWADFPPPEILNSTPKLTKSPRVLAKANEKLTEQRAPLLNQVVGKSFNGRGQVARIERGPADEHYVVLVQAVERSNTDPPRGIRHDEAVLGYLSANGTAVVREVYFLEHASNIAKNYPLGKVTSITSHKIVRITIHDAPISDLPGITRLQTVRILLSR